MFIKNCLLTICQYNKVTLINNTIIYKTIFVLNCNSDFT